MKKSKLVILIVSIFVVIGIAIGGVTYIYSNLEKNNVFNGELLKLVDENTVKYSDNEYKKGEIVKVEDKKLSKCLLLLDGNSGVTEIFTSKYAPLFEKEEKTQYYLREIGNIIVEKQTHSKSDYSYSAYSKKTFSLPEFKIENIKRVQVCFGDYYDQKKNVINDFAKGVSATVDGYCSVFNIREYAEINDEKELRRFVSEFDSTNGLEEVYKYWSKHSGRENVFFQVIFTDDDLPCSLLFTKDAIFVD